MSTLEDRLAALTPEQRRRMEQFVRARQDVTQLEPGRVPPGKAAPLTPGQARLWRVQQAHPGRPIDVVCQTVHLRDVDPATVLSRLAAFSARHVIFAIRFDEVGDEIHQRVGGAPRVDLAAGTAIESASEAAHQARALAAGTTDVTSGALLRVRACPDNTGGVWCLIATHNLVFDAWSFQLLLEELAGQQSTEAATFLDFADWQAAWTASDSADSAAEYWREIMRQPPRPMPSDLAREREPSRDGARHVIDVPPRVSDRFAALAREESCSVFSVWAVAVHASAARYGQDDDVVIGTFNANREQTASHGTIGYLLNVVPLRLRLRLEDSVSERVQAAWAAVRSTQRFAAYPGELIAQQWGRDVQHAHPLFDWVLVLEDVASTDTAKPWSAYELADVARGTARYDLTITVAPWPNGTEIWLEYDTSRYQAQTIVALGESIQVECERMCAGSGSGAPRPDARGRGQIGEHGADR
jgi:hypothetical protein